MSSIFKRFSIQSVSQLAATAGKQQKMLRSQLQDAFPTVSVETWEEILPKKQDIMLVPCTDPNVDLICLLAEDKKTLDIAFFMLQGGEFLPHLRLLHRFPWMLPKHQCDIGGCKFVVSGATVMAPGLNHPTGGKVAPDVPAGAVVGIYIEGKEHAVAVGVALQSSEQIKKENSGLAIENTHHLGDGLWQLPKLTQEALSGKKK